MMPSHPDGTPDTENDPSTGAPNGAAPDPQATVDGFAGGPTDGPTDGRTDGPAGGPTGDASVDAVLTTLDRLDQLAVEEHLPVFEEAHRALRASLDRPAEAAGSGD